MMGDTRPRWAEFVSTLVIAVGVLAAVAPLGRVLDGGDWFIGVGAVTVPVLLVGALARLTRWPGLALGAEAVTWVLAVTVTQLRAEAVGGVIPGPAAIEAAVSGARASVAEVVTGTSPLPVSAGLSLVVAAAAGLIALLVDQIAVSARVPLMAGPVLISVVLVPSIAVTDSFDAVPVAVVAGVVLVLCALETGTRREAVPPARGRGVRTVVTAASTVVILVATLVIAPIVPHGAPVFDLGRGTSGTSISTSLDLGDDLRLPAEVEVFRVRTNAPGYLRALTITDLGPDGWRADDTEAETVPLSEIPPVADDRDVERDVVAVDVEITGLTSTRLPLPYPATSVSGLPNDSWRLAPADRTVTGDATSDGLQYRAVASVPLPTTEQLRRATTGDADARTTEVPAGLPDVISDQARAVTAEARTDYDRLIALQDWFRGDDFRYSLTAPSRFGYDDGGVAATEQFLRLREGYCVHFASAFTLMARSLGIPTRIVVGYRPGTPIAPAGDTATVYSVTNRELHAWPEVHFDGIGWVGFEPTHDLGEPEALTPLTEPTTAPSGSPSTPADPAPAAPPQTAPPAEEPEILIQTVPEPGRREAPPLLPLGFAVLLLALLAFPAILRGVRDARATVRARSGDAGAAWGIVRRRAIDLGIPIAPSDSPRAIGDRLVRDGAPTEAVARLVAAVEAVAYGPPGSGTAAEGLADDATHVRAALTAAARPLRRLRAAVLPVSAFRPSSERRDRTG